VKGGGRLEGEGVVDSVHRGEPSLGGFQVFSSANDREYPRRKENKAKLYKWQRVSPFNRKSILSALCVKMPGRQSSILFHMILCYNRLPIAFRIPMLHYPPPLPPPAPPTKQRVPLGHMPLKHHL